MFPERELDIAFQALDRVNTVDKSYSRADELSGGQQQRVAIARVLAQEAKIILADEPAASLDPLTTKQVMDDLKRINQELGIGRPIGHDEQLGIGIESGLEAGLGLGSLRYEQQCCCAMGASETSGEATALFDRGNHCAHPLGKCCQYRLHLRCSR
ncbi:hypothetical protein PAECIP111893_03528 [Paenibacillus plantiphilus]|uniref:ABC transporter domain-containing protein n=1 Tax=Paenibacillus plantiphilus TaxID=2905650 RepID=A0ABM9CHS8_9BACL|nr:hypothetical protein PAECIP111893_03528 [Paenibacillus plantiphilus]